MGYYINADTVSLNSLQKRLQETDLIPSHEPLLIGIAEKMGLLVKADIGSLADLRVALKTIKSSKLLSKSSGVDTDYLLLLRRVVNGFFPKPRALKDIDWLDTKSLAGLSKVGVKNTQQLYDRAFASGDDLAEEAGINSGDLSRLLEISDLCRIQWVSPVFARAIVAAGITNVDMVATADPETLYGAITKANEGAAYYKGKIGLRDIRRLVTAASYVS